MRSFAAWNVRMNSPRTSRTQAMKSIYYEWRKREQWSCEQSISNLHVADCGHSHNMYISIFYTSIAYHIYALRTQTNDSVPLFRPLVSSIWNKLNENEPRRKQVQARADRTRYEKNGQKCIFALSVVFFPFGFLSGPIWANSHLRIHFAHKSSHVHILSENTTISGSSDSNSIILIENYE